MPALPEPPFRAALLLPRWLGDAVMASSLIGPLFDLSGAPVEVWGPQAFSELFIAGGEIASYRVFDGHGIHRGLRGLLRFRREFDRSRPDVLWVLPDSFSSAMAARYSGVRHRVGRSTQGRGFFLTSALSGLVRDRSRHWIVEKADLLGSGSGGDADLDFRPRLGLFDPPDEFERWLNRAGLFTNEYVVYAPGAIFGPGKRWLGFAALSSRLPEQLETVLVGSEPDRTHIESLEAELIGSGHRVRSFIGSLPLSRLARLFASARFTLSNDSGAMHLAAAAGGRVLGLFLSTDPVWTAPLGPQARVLAAEVECRPCFKRQCPLPEMICQDSISAERVHAALADWIAEES